MQTILDAINKYGFNSALSDPSLDIRKSETNFYHERIIRRSLSRSSTCQQSLYNDNTFFVLLVDLRTCSRQYRCQLPSNGTHTQYNFCPHNIIGHYNPSVRIIDLVSHTTYVMRVNFIYKWRDLQFKVGSERQIF